MKQQILFLIICLVLCGCNQSTDVKPVAKSKNEVRQDSAKRDIYIVPHIIDTDTPGVYTKIWKQRILLSVDNIEVMIINNTNEDIEYGGIYYIEKKGADGWKRVALYKDTLGNIIAFNSLGYSLKPNAVTENTYSLIKCAHKYTAGKYRIVIPYIQNGVNKDMFCEFCLVKDNKE